MGMYFFLRKRKQKNFFLFSQKQKKNTNKNKIGSLKIFFSFSQNKCEKKKTCTARSVNYTKNRLDSASEGASVPNVGHSVFISYIKQ